MIADKDSDSKLTIMVDTWPPATREILHVGPDPHKRDGTDKHSVYW